MTDYKWFSVAAFLLALSPLLLGVNRWIEAAVAGALYAAMFCWLRRDLASEAISRVGRMLGMGGVAQETS